tara:strand:- start:3107 stop:3343 length:237 start_codon:yes stop_codon:yes gene_type:complete
MTTNNFKEPARLSMPYFRKMVDNINLQPKEQPKKRGLLAPVSMSMNNVETRTNSPLLKAARYARQIRDEFESKINGIS